jgi:hypothetical protein
MIHTCEICGVRTRPHLSLLRTPWGIPVPLVRVVVCSTCAGRAWRTVESLEGKIWPTTSPKPIAIADARSRTG